MFYNSGMSLRHTEIYKNKLYWTIQLVEILILGNYYYIIIDHWWVGITGAITGAMYGTQGTFGKVWICLCLDCIDFENALISWESD